MQVNYSRIVSLDIPDYIVEAVRSLREAGRNVSAVRLIRAHARAAGHESVGLCEAKEIFDKQI